MGTGIKHCLCPTKEKYILCFLLQAGKNQLAFAKAFGAKDSATRLGWLCPKPNTAGMGVGGTGMGVAARRL